MKRLFRLKAACALALAVCIGAGGAWAAPWSFGVMSDTQWIGANADGKNPNSVPVGIIDQIDPQLIKAGVKFVIQVGDLTDNGSSAAMAERAKASQTLYDAGIGFYPLRGNHEGLGKCGRPIPGDSTRRPGAEGGTRGGGDALRQPQRQVVGRPELLFRLQ